ncbi:hypothetical protein MMC11_007288 [Xylographa trunciseda]|nr:hypothetical protein [Xylographa trunciseda]
MASYDFDFEENLAALEYRPATEPLQCVIVCVTSVPEDELGQWLDKKPAWDDVHQDRVVASLRLIIDCDSSHRVGDTGIVSLRRDTFCTMVSRFNLPKAYVVAIRSGNIQSGRFNLKDIEATEIDIIALTTRIVIATMSLGAIEKQTGYSNLDDFQFDSPKCSLTKPNLDLSKTRQSLGLTVYKLAANQDMHDTIMKWKTSFIKRWGTINEKLLQEEESKVVIKEQLNVIALRMRGYYTGLTFLENRADIQQSTLYNLVAREDSKANTDIARASRSIALASQRDSASMKTIAVLTMAFLPATWVAALFAMPLFNWRAAPGDPVLQGYFWIYWAVICPLTTAVLFLWWQWKEWRNRKDVAENEALENDTKPEFLTSCESMTQVSDPSPQDNATISPLDRYTARSRKHAGTNLSTADAKGKFFFTSFEAEGKASTLEARCNHYLRICKWYHDGAARPRT